jgi:hypothetical protein
LKRERDDAIEEAAALKGTVEDLTQARAGAEARAVELSQRLRKVRQSKVQETARSIGAAFSPFVIAAAVATVGYWTYQFIGSGSPPLAPTSEPASAEKWAPATTKEAGSVQQPVLTNASVSKRDRGTPTYALSNRSRAQT